MITDTGEVKIPYNSLANSCISEWILRISIKHFQCHYTEKGEYDESIGIDLVNFIKLVNLNNSRETKEMVNQDQHFGMRKSMLMIE